MRASGSCNLAVPDVVCRSHKELWHLDQKIAQVLTTLESSERWRTLTSDNTPSEVVQAILREVHLEIFSYNASIVEATIALIGQMPRSLPVRRLKAMLFHQADEFDHGEMGLRDYVALGGDEREARTRRISPAAFAAAGVWWMMVHQRDPFAYLGAEYLFESLTPLVCERAMPLLAARGIAGGTMEFIKFHAEEDPAHANLMRQLIRDVVKQYPEAEESIRYGMDCFVQVYPMPVWRAALQRVVNS